jgi:NAD(P)-dependent dehydrogenase (short-subunit alcohol dehydrogenase family)
MGDAEAIRGLVERTIEAFGGIDVIVNNAATNPVYGPLLETDVAVFDKIMAVNVKGPLELAKLAHPHLRKRGGSVINISSVGGLRPEPLLGIYSVSKAALISLTKVMAQEWGRDNIRANVICPGLVRTKFSAALWQNEQVLKEFMRALPLGRIAEPEEMVGLALFLASPASSYCTGGVYLADGGHIL